MTTESAGRATAAGPAYRRRMLAVCALGWAVLQGGRFLLPPLLPRIEATLGLSSAASGLALTAFGLVYAVTQYPSGAYSDGLSRATLVVPALVVLLAAFALVGIAVHPALFLLGILLLGAGKGLYASPSRALVGDLYAGDRGRALGVYAAGTDVGGLVAAGLAAVVLGVTVTWRVAFVPVVLALVLVTVLFVGWNREPYAFEREPLRLRETVGRVVATPGQRERLVAFALFYFAVGGFANFFPTLVGEAGYSEATASAVFAAVFVVGMVTKPTAGVVSDRLSRPPVAVAGLLVAASGVAVVLSAGSLPVLVAGTLLAAAGYKTQFPIADAVVMEAAPDGEMGGDLGAARGVFLGANALGPGVVGVVADATSFATAFWLVAGAFVAAAAVLLAGYRR